MRLSRHERGWSTRSRPLASVSLDPECVPSRSMTRRCACTFIHTPLDQKPLDCNMPACPHTRMHPECRRHVSKATHAAQAQPRTERLTQILWLGWSSSGSQRHLKPQKLLHMQLCKRKEAATVDEFHLIQGCIEAFNRAKICDLGCSSHQFEPIHRQHKCVEICSPGISARSTQISARSPQISARSKTWNLASWSMVWGHLGVISHNTIVPKALAGPFRSSETFHGYGQIPQSSWFEFVFTSVYDYTGTLRRANSTTSVGTSPLTFSGSVTRRLCLKYSIAVSNFASGHEIHG